MNKEEVKVALLTQSLFLYVHPNHSVLPEKTTCFDKSFFFVIFACGKLYCCAVIFGLRRVILCFAQFNGKYNITETEGFNITFVLTKISLQRSWNITKNRFASLLFYFARKKHQSWYKIGAFFNEINPIGFVKFPTGVKYCFAM